MEPKRIYRAIKQEVSDEKFSIPIGKAKVISEGTDVTIIAFGKMTYANARKPWLWQRKQAFLQS